MKTSIPFAAVKTFLAEDKISRLITRHGDIFLLIFIRKSEVGFMASVEEYSAQ